MPDRGAGGVAGNAGGEGVWGEEGGGGGLIGG